MSLAQLLEEYGESHQHPTNIGIHKVCVPAITFSVIGLLTGIEQILLGIPIVVWILALVSLYYIKLSCRYYLFILPMLIAFTGFSFYLKSLGVLLSVSLFIFLTAWIGQFYGHKVEGKKPSFFTDIKFLLIGPLWTIKTVLKLKY